MSDEKQLSVLLIEDDPDLRHGWEDIFELLGHKFASFETASELLENLDLLKSCDLVITDYYLPDFNGITLTKKLREAAPSMPVIVLTGSREAFIKETVQSTENCYILYKPLNIDDIENTISKIFHNQ